MHQNPKIYVNLFLYYLLNKYLNYFLQDLHEDNFNYKEQQNEEVDAYLLLHELNILQKELFQLYCCIDLFVRLFWHFKSLQLNLWLIL